MYEHLLKNKSNLIATKLKYSTCTCSIILYFFGIFLFFFCIFLVFFRYLLVVFLPTFEFFPNLY